jgi:hypothetical protein
MTLGAVEFQDRVQRYFAEVLSDGELLLTAFPGVGPPLGAALAGASPGPTMGRMNVGNARPSQARHPIGVHRNEMPVPVPSDAAQAASLEGEGPVVLASSERLVIPQVYFSLFSGG